MKKIAVFTSGGDAPGMNACLSAVVRSALHFEMDVLGIYRGYQGMIDADFEELDGNKVYNIIHQGGTILRSARCEDFRTPEGRKKAYHNLKKEGIEGIVAIGGDGTFTGANIFIQEYPDIKMVGCPGTIDNDLVGTDYSIGYDTAINTAMEAIDKIKDTANAHDRLFFVEVMGRHSGSIALSTGLATGAEAIVIPENVSTLKDLISELEACFARRQNSSIVIVAEGDDMGGAIEISNKVKDRFDKYEIRVCILGHMQRGGSPTCMERVRAMRMGTEAVKALRNDQNGIMIGIVNNKITYTPFSEAIKDQSRLEEDFVEVVNILSRVV